MGTTAYRLVQEALTNVMRHAGQHAGERACVDPSGHLFVGELPAEDVQQTAAHRAEP